MPTRLAFASDHSITVDQDLNAVEAAIRTASPNPAPLAEFTKKEAKVLVNVALIRSIQPAKERSGKAVF